MKTCDACGRQTEKTYPISQGDCDADECAECYLLATERVA